MRNLTTEEINKIKSGSGNVVEMSELVDEVIEVNDSHYDHKHAYFTTDGTFITYSARKADMKHRGEQLILVNPLSHKNSKFALFGVIHK